MLAPFSIVLATSSVLSYTGEAQWFLLFKAQTLYQSILEPLCGHAKLEFWPPPSSCSSCGICAAFLEIT